MQHSKPDDGDDSEHDQEPPDDRDDEDDHGGQDGEQDDEDKVMECQPSIALLYSKLQTQHTRELIQVKTDLIFTGHSSEADRYI